MQKITMIAVLSAVVLSVPLAFADDAHHPAKDKKSAPATATKPTVAAEKSADMQMGNMQEMKKKMQAQMDKIQKTSDPKERQKLMQEHMQSMREGMKMMSGGMGAGGDMMGKRMEMMQMMMEQMMEHQGQQGSMQMTK